GRDTSVKNKEIIKNIKEIFNNLKIIHIDNIFETVAPKLIDDGKIWVNAQENLQVNTFLLKIFAEILAMITIIFLMFYMLVNNQQEIIVASLGFYIYAFYRAFPSMQSIFTAFISIKGWSKVLDNVYEKINDDQIKLKLGEDKINFSEKIVIENLYYKYQEDDEPIINDLNLEIKKGTIIGLKGESGSGKTTFLDILSGIKAPTNGYVKIDGVPLNLKNVLNWFSKISYVPQKIFLFNDSIKNNLNIQNHEVPNEEIFKILNIVDLDIFLNDHKHLNLDTKVSELNNNLSGGEIQRLSIAKSLLKYPNLLIMDETTSGIQIEKEKKIIENIKKFFPNITIIFISHRDKSFEICDKVINF
ncbi:ATP-binding cassette domain-containing protein, partial [Candidatus Pelagibacter sp.]|nr:ATP-binding cassette domain-containing protein [Candidatus Pelagibacter sp.]